MRINVVHALPRTSSAFGKDEDGFSAAMRVLADRHDVRWLNVHPANPDHRKQRSLICDADVVLVRSDWGWYPDRAAAAALARTARPCALLIAGSSRPPTLRQQMRYDALLFETPWYAQFVTEHPFAVGAFGIDTDVMRDLGRSRDIDHLFVGRLASFKRPLRLLDKPGQRVAVGDFASASEEIKRRLTDSGVELIDHVSQEELAQLYNRSRSVFVPCELQGGGERAVLEGRACGCAVEIADDNPKLASLLDAPVRSHRDYAREIERTLEAVLAGCRVAAPVKRAGYLAYEAAVAVDKVRRAPQTVRIRWRNRRAGR